MPREVKPPPPPWKLRSLAREADELLGKRYDLGERGAEAVPKIIDRKLSEIYEEAGGLDYLIPIIESISTARKLNQIEDEAVRTNERISWVRDWLVFLWMLTIMTIGMSLLIIFSVHAPTK